MAKVRLTDEAREDLRDLDGSQRKLALKGMKKLEVEPEKRGQPLGSTPRGSLTGFRKLVVGDRDLRIVYRVEDDSVVVIWVVAERADAKCYELAVARIQMQRPAESEPLLRALHEVATVARITGR